MRDRASQQPQSNDSPPLIAGRVSLAEGDAQIWRAEEDSDGEWDVAQINDVVTVGTGLVHRDQWPHRIQSRSEYVSAVSRQAAVVLTNSTTAAQCSISNTDR